VDARPRRARGRARRIAALVSIAGHATDQIGLTITPAVAEELLAHARAELPNEACALLSGSLVEHLALRFHPARNSEASPLRYNVDPEDLVRITFAIEDAGEDLVGIFHSHTRSPAVPSATDRRTAQYPDVFYVLATLADPSAPAARALRAWRIHGGQSFEVPLHIR
jgi:proteasome lid subunit RPN8/RPN11